MNVALPAELEKRVTESVERGRFASPEEFFKEAAELMLDAYENAGEAVPLEGHFESRLETLIEEAQTGEEATEMTDRDWKEVERQGVALIRARKKA